MGRDVLLRWAGVRAVSSPTCWRWPWRQNADQLPGLNIVIWPQAKRLPAVALFGELSTSTGTLWLYQSLPALHCLESGRASPRVHQRLVLGASSVPAVGGLQLRGAAVPGCGPSSLFTDLRGDAGMEPGFGVSSCVPNSALEIKNQSDYSSP